MAAPVKANVIALVLSSSRFVAKRREVVPSGCVRAASQWQHQAARCAAFPSHQPASGRPGTRVQRLRMETWLPNWQNRGMSSGGPSTFGGFSGLALRWCFPKVSFRPVPPLQSGPFGKAWRRLQAQRLRRQNHRQTQALWNPAQSTKPRAITMGSTGRGVSSGPAKPGWLSGRAG